MGRSRRKRRASPSAAERNIVTEDASNNDAARADSGVKEDTGAFSASDFAALLRTMQELWLEEKALQETHAGSKRVPREMHA
jgi:hypothetical protein